MTPTHLVGTPVDAVVVRAVLAVDLDVAPDDPRVDAVIRFVDERVHGAATPVRAGARLASALLVPVVLATTGLRSDRSAVRRLGAVLGGIERMSLPGIGDYVRMIRALTLVAWFDTAGSRL